MNGIIERMQEVYRDEGPLELGKRSTHFVTNQIFPYWRFRFFTRKHEIMNRIKFDAPAHPYKKIEVDPNKFMYKNVRVRSAEYGLGRIESGDWDLPENSQPFKEKDKYRAIKKRFEDNEEWESTDYYQRIKRKYDGNVDRFDYYDTLYEDMKQNGYRTNQEKKKDKMDYRERAKLEVLVTIDRKGNFNIYDGWHRTSIARILNLNIYVQVVARHKKWQDLRDEIYNNGITKEHKEKLIHHPDLKDIIN